MTEAEWHVCLRTAGLIKCIVKQTSVICASQKNDCGKPDASHCRSLFGHPDNFKPETPPSFHSTPTHMFMFLLLTNHTVLTSHITVSLFVEFFKNAATANGEGLLYHTENGFFPCNSVIQDLEF